MKLSTSSRVARAAALVSHVVLSMAWLPSVGQAQDPTETQEAGAERLRAQVASQVQLVAASLLDELVFQWNEAPPFEANTPVVLGGLSVPYGLGTGLEALLENHLYELLLRQPRAHLKPVHCPACTGMVVQSKPEGTVLARGFELPGALARIAPNPNVKHVLFLDFEAEGSNLVLRAKLTALEEGLPIVAAKTVTTSTAAPALLRDPRNLKSASEARREYTDLLRGRDRFFFPVRATARIYASPKDGAAPSPFVWFDVGAETFFTQEQQWGGGVSLGLTSLRGLHEGWSVGAHAVRLVSGATRSLTRPDVYLVAGGSILDMKGQNVRPFLRDPTSAAELKNQLDGKEPRATVATWRVGMELRIKNRFSAMLFGEAVPTANNKALGSYVSLGPMSIRCVGLEAGLWF